MNTLLQIPDYPPEDRQHAIAAEVERYESVPVDDTPDITDPEQLHKMGFGDGFGNRPQDKRFAWSLDYMAGYRNGLCEVFQHNPGMQFPVNLNHSEADEF